MKIHFFILTSVSMCFFSSCSVKQSLERNRDAIDMSTQAIYENAQAIECANRSIEENRRQIEEINRTLKKANES